MKYLLIDTANMFFRARHGAHRASDTWTKLGFALHVTMMAANKVAKRFRADHVIFALEGRSWRKELDDPAALGCGWRVKCQQGLALLASHGGTQPTKQEAHGRLAHVRGFIKDQQVMRSALVLLLVFWVWERSKLHLDGHAINAPHAPDIVLAVVSIATADQLGDAVQHAGQLGAVQSKDADFAMAGQCFAAGQVSLAASRRAAVANDVGLAFVCHGLWARQWAPQGLVAG